MTSESLPIPLLTALVFTLMGPVALIPLFAGLTKGADGGLRLRIALTAGLTAFAALTLAVLAGAGALARTGTSPSSLIVAAGLILTLTALRAIFGTAPAAGVPAGPPTAGLGMAPIAIPGIVSPVGVAVLIIFASYFPATSDRLAILGVAGGVMVLNVGAMLGASWFMRRIGTAPLILLGAVFGVLQAALGIEMIVSGLARSALWAG